MTAPDRIWLQHPEDWNEVSEPNWFEESEGVTWCWEPINQDDVEYIRKGAFPVEEIRRQVGVLSQAPRFLQGSDLALFRRILSLLEDSE